MKHMGQSSVSQQPQHLRVVPNTRMMDDMNVALQPGLRSVDQNPGIKKKKIKAQGSDIYIYTYICTGTIYVDMNAEIYKCVYIYVYNQNKNICMNIIIIPKT